MEKKQIEHLIERLSFRLFDTTLHIQVEEDHIYKHPVSGHGRPYLVVSYAARCTDTGELKSWRGRKWYLSEHMTDDEVVKTAYAACKAAVEHEVMEAFKMDGQKLFNPHTPYPHLRLASQFEVRRDAPPNNIDAAVANPPFTGEQPISLMNDRNDHTGGDEFIVHGVRPYADL